MNFIQKYGLELKLVHMVKGHGLLNLIVEAIDRKNEESEGWGHEIEMYLNEFPSTYDSSPWYSNLKRHIGQGNLPPTLLSHEKVNLGIEVNPKFVNIGLGCSSDERKYLINLFKRYRDTFTYMYDNLKTYNT